MEMSIIKSIRDYEMKIRNTMIIIVTSLVVSVLVNIILTIYRNDSNHYLYLIINILVDLISIYLSYYLLKERLIPYKRLKGLYERGMKQEPFIGTIREIDKKTTRIQDFDCHKVIVETEKDTIELYMIDGLMDLKKDSELIIRKYTNIICQVEAIGNEN